TGSAAHRTTLGQRVLHALGRGASRAVRADGAGGRTVTDELDARFLHCGRSAAATIELDAAGFAAQAERCQVTDGGSEARRPEDRVHTFERAVSPAHAVGFNALEHRPTIVVRTETLGLALLLPKH